MILSARTNIKKVLEATFSSAEEIVVCENFKKRQSIVSIVLPWWKSLGLGFFQWNCRRKIGNILYRYGLSEMAYTIKVF